MKLTPGIMFGVHVCICDICKVFVNLIWNFLQIVHGLSQNLIAQLSMSILILARLSPISDKKRRAVARGE